MEEEYKGYKIVGDGTFGMKLIKPVGKGSVPKELRGMYSDVYMAKRAIDLHGKPSKVTNSGKAE